jgi:hypothetical protein
LFETGIVSQLGNDRTGPGGLTETRAPSGAPRAATPSSLVDQCNDGASMAVAELVKFAAGWPTPLAPRFQLDVLRGPGFGEEFPQERRSDCLCVVRRRNIERLREQRLSASAA